jgi:dehydratase
MRDLSRRVRHGIAGAAVVAGALMVPSVASAGTTPSGPRPTATNPVPVDYSCFVTFQGGSTFVPYNLAFDVAAPASSRRWLPFRAVLDTPAITPNPTLQSDVRDVEVVFALPENTRLLATWLTGGGDFGDAPPTVEVDGDVVRLRAAGPFPSATAFDLPALNLLLVGTEAGTATTATGGTSTDDPSFSWTRNSLSPGDPPGTLRPFDCQPPAPVVFTRTAIG